LRRRYLDFAVTRRVGTTPDPTPSLAGGVSDRRASRERLDLAGVEHPLARDAGLDRDRAGIGVELEVGGGMGVGGEQELAAGHDREPGELPVEVLAAREAVDLDRHPMLGAGGEHHLPARPQARPLVEVAAPGVGQHVDAGRRDRAQQALGLVAVRVELAVDRGHHALDLAALAVRHVNATVLEHLDLEPLHEVEVVAVARVPRVDRRAAGPAFAVESGGDVGAWSGR
jgi:hypothetical protein